MSNAVELPTFYVISCAVCSKPTIRKTKNFCHERRLLDRPQQPATFVQADVVGPVVEGREPLRALASAAAAVGKAVRVRPPVVIGFWAGGIGGSAP
jgi:hypothetical protein